LISFTKVLITHNKTYIEYLRNASFGVVFLGTLHHGSRLADKPWLPVAQKLVSWANLRYDVGPLVGELETFSNTLEDTARDFSHIAATFDIRSFYEQKPT
jgi:hypothetical protein